jgi:dTDP-4-dehydrorhamnose reductase
MGFSPMPEKDMNVLIFGKSGWLGGWLGGLCKEKGIKYQFATARMENRESVAAELDKVKPTHIMNAAGMTGRPNVDWCESHKEETMRVNVIGTMNVADLANERGIHVTLYATGCIFEYDDKHKEGSGIGFKEEDTPNFHGSFYSHTKALVEDMLKNYPNVCILRVRMPIGDDLTFHRNFIYKIAKYDKVVNIPNSMTVLPEMMPISLEMARRGLVGIYNFTNPGVVSHNEILEMYKEYYDPAFTWKNFSVEEQAKVIVAARSNNELDCTKLKAEFPEMLDIKSSLIKYIFEPNKCARALPRSSPSKPSRPLCAPSPTPRSRRTRH